jgi:hypothetical protein
VSLAVAAILLAQPSPPAAEANIGCSVATAPEGAITEGIGAITGGAIGGGNPVGDACNSVTDGAVEAVTSPVTSALKGIGKGVLGQLTSWVSEGATWLMGEVVAEIDKTTTPQLTSEGFLSEYARMSQVAAILAAAMFVMALLEAVVQGSWAVLGKAIFVSVPLAFVGTSIAFVLVQLLLVITDGMSHAVTVATQEDSTHFFKAAIGDLSKAGGTVAGAAGKATAGEEAAVVNKAAGSVEVPLFVTFLAAIVGAIAAFCVWIELLFRDAAVYVVVLFMPLAAAASISPRWAHILRRYVELIVTVIGSKFVIVSVVALAASLISEKGASVEHIVAAAALLMVACFCPFLFFRLVLSTEAAASAAFARRSVGGHAVGVMQMAGGPQGFANMARTNWSGPEVWSVGEGAKGPKGSDGGGEPGPPGGPGLRPPGSGDGGSGAGGPGAGSGGSSGGGAVAGEAAATGAAGVVVAGVEASAQAARSTAQHLEQSGTAQITAGQASAAPASSPAPADGAGGAGTPAEPPEREAAPPLGGESGGRGPAEAPPRPPREGQGSTDG